VVGIWIVMWMMTEDMIWFFLGFLFWIMFDD